MSTKVFQDRYVSKITKEDREQGRAKSIAPLTIKFWVGNVEMNPRAVRFSIINMRSNEKASDRREWPL